MLPRLLYLGDVPVEASYHGSALLFRLLRQYPPDRLRIIEGNLLPSQVDRRLPGVRYQALEVGRARLLNSRLHDWYSAWLAARSAARTRQLPGLLDGFEPDAVVTVAHGHSWVTAARFAAERALPLYLICHDDWPSVVSPALRNRADRELGDAYRQAVARFCTSPFMVAEYRRRYGVDGTVLYPSRGSEAPHFQGPADRLCHETPAPVFAFAGTINSAGYARLLRQLADGLDPHNGTLLVFGPLTQAQAAKAGLDHPRIRICGLLPSGELMTRLRHEADALYVPMSFAPEDRINMQMGFPSKLTDYTAIGLPMLVCAPPYSSVVQWVHANPGVAEVVTSEQPAALVEAVARIARDPAHRRRLAERAQEIGDRFFSVAETQAVFIGALKGRAASAVPAGR